LLGLDVLHRSNQLIQSWRVDRRVLRLDLDANAWASEPEWPWSGQNVDALVGAGGTHERGVALRLEQCVHQQRHVVALEPADDHLRDLVASEAFQIDKLSPLIGVISVRKCGGRREAFPLKPLATSSQMRFSASFRLTSKMVIIAPNEKSNLIERGAGNIQVQPFHRANLSC
jgi:hypothetical protein